jgi:hypothetical protein
MRRAINVPITRVGRRRSGPRESPALDAGADATPEATRDFPSTESLLIRFDAYSPGGDARSLNAAVLSRAGHRTSTCRSRARRPVHRIKISLALGPLPTCEYVLKVVASPDGSRQLAAFRIR